MEKLRGTGLDPFSAAELSAWRGFLRMHAIVIARLTEQMEAMSRLTLAESEVLLKLSLSDGGRLPLSKLGTKTYLTLSPSGLSRLIDRLSARGLVARESEQTGDRRAVNVHLTERGRQTWDAVAGPHQELVREVFLDPLDDDELQRLGTVWERLLREDQPTSDATRD